MNVVVHLHIKKDYFVLFSIVELNEILRENENLKEQRLCKICLDEDAGVLFEPCGHICCCTSCGVPLQQCPICRTSITNIIKAYISWIRLYFVDACNTKVYFVFCFVLFLLFFKERNSQNLIETTKQIFRTLKINFYSK